MAQEGIEAAGTPEVPLRVAEAVAEDLGRGIVRVDPLAARTLGVVPGDVVWIRGRKATVARVVASAPQLAGRGLAQMDGVIRENAAASLGETVHVRRAAHRPALTVVLTPVATTRDFHREEDLAALRQALIGLALVPGDLISVSLFGSRGQLFNVAGTAPAQVPVEVTAGTAVRVLRPDGADHRGFRVSYEDIGGLGRQLERVREMVELPLKHPEWFARLGVEPPKGVLIHGPPGTGKTLIARAIATETNAHFIHVDGPELTRKFYGESESALRQVFEEARQHAPSIIFLDEIDAIAPRRSAVFGEVEKRMVAQLLALMDGLVSRGEVIVVGATNLPDAVDPALRRPGRFDRELELPVPDQAGRLEILRIHSRAMPLAPDVDLAWLARVTHGYVGADLEMLCKEAGMSALRRLAATAGPDEAMAAGLIARAQVTLADFREGLREVEPTARRELFAEKPSVGWSDVGGLSEVKAALRAAVEWPLRYPRLGRRLGVRPPAGILLSGPPGTGKTLVARALAGESEIPFIAVDRTTLVSKWLGESEKALREVFRKARQSAPCVLFFDELDALAPARGAAGVDQAAGRLVSQLLDELDGAGEASGVTILAATNREDLVEPALLRHGRFDLILRFPAPDRADRLAILRIHTSGRPLAGDVDLEGLADATAGLVGADLEALCRRAASLAMAEWLAAGGGDEVPDSAVCQIRDAHFRAALEVALANPCPPALPSTAER